MEHGPSGHFKAGIYRGIVVIVCGVGSLHAQSIYATPPNALPGATVQPYVSLHQLKAPAKAQKEVRRAAEDIERGRKDSAKQHITAALDAYSDYSVALALRAMLEFSDYDDERALADVQRSISVDPGCVLAYLLNAEIDSTTGRYEDALTVLKRASELLSWTWQYHYELCKALLGTRQYSLSLNAINTALQLTSATKVTTRDLALLHFFRAWVYARMDNKNSARTEYEEAEKRDPNGNVGTEARRQLSLLR